MGLIEFPIIRINSHTWQDGEESIPLFDEFIYTSSKEIFDEFYLNKEFADCKGEVYKIIDRVLPTSFWRNLLRFLPGVYKVKLIFRKANKRLELEELKRDLIQGIMRFETTDSDEFTKKWIIQIKNSKNIREIIDAESV